MSATILNFDRSERKRQPSMIRVQLNDGREIGVAWKHTSIASKPNASGEVFQLRATYCTLFEIDGDNLQIIARGVSKCSYLDNFKKETGRKLSLRDAFTHTNLSPTDRQQVWGAYLNRPRPKNEVPPTIPVVENHLTDTLLHVH